MYKDQFIASLHAKTKIILTFYSKEDNSKLKRLCAPMDYGPFKAAKNPANRYHLWDYESDKKNHNLSLLPENIVSMEFLIETFDPEEFVTWKCNWHVVRDWGTFS